MRTNKGKRKRVFYLLPLPHPFARCQLTPFTRCLVMELLPTAAIRVERPITDGFIDDNVAI
ncbi:MAG: hypothetical protein ACRDHW_20510, partial [Ktedonobacteraceae bacterium]